MLSRAGGLLPTHVDALEMDGQKDQLLLGELLVVGVEHILANALGALIVLLAAAGDHLAEHGVVLITAVRYGLSLEQPLGEIAQMDCKAAEIQRLPVKGPLVVVLHHRQSPLNQAGNVVHIGHIGVKLGLLAACAGAAIAK